MHTDHPTRRITPARQWPRLFLGLDHDAAHVVAAIRADHVRRDGRAALRAIVQLLRLLAVVSPPGASLGVRLTSLWNGHGRVILKSGHMAQRPRSGRPKGIETGQSKSDLAGCQPRISHSSHGRNRGQRRRPLEAGMFKACYNRHDHGSDLASSLHFRERPRSLVLDHIANRHMWRTLMNSSTVVIALFALSLSGHAALASSIGVNFSNDPIANVNYDLAPTDVTGVVPQGNWNNAHQTDASLPNLIDDQGNPTGASLTAWNHAPVATSVPTGTPTGDLLHEGDAYFGNGSIQVSNIPYATYDVYAYIAGGLNGSGQFFANSDSIYDNNGTQGAAFAPARVHPASRRRLRQLHRFHRPEWPDIDIVRHRHNRHPELRRVRWLSNRPNAGADERRSPCFRIDLAAGRRPATRSSGEVRLFSDREGHQEKG